MCRKSIVSVDWISYNFRSFIDSIFSAEPDNKSVYLRSTTRAGSVLRLLGVWADLGGTNNNSYPYPQKTNSNFLTGSLGAFGGIRH